MSDTTTATVGLIGLGIMGGAYARNLIKAGFVLHGFDIAESSLSAFSSLGGNPCISPADVVAHADIVITSLPSVASFHTVISGENGATSTANKDTLIIETSTLPIEDKMRAREALQAVNADMLDCPVSGTGAQAASKDLSVYVSGDEAARHRCDAVFSGIGKETFYVGDFGNGSKMKFVANLLVQIHNIASAEAMVLGMKAGLDPQTIYEVVKAGAGNSRIFELRAPMMVQDDYTNATMKVDVWEKDIAIISEFATSLQCPTPLFTSGTDLYRAASANGQGKLDTASVCLVLEQLANLDRNSTA